MFKTIAVIIILSAMLCTVSFAQITYEVDPVDGDIGIITETQPDKIDRKTLKQLRAKRNAVKDQIDHLVARTDVFRARRDLLNVKIAALLAIGLNDPPE